MTQVPDIALLGSIPARLSRERRQGLDAVREELDLDVLGFWSFYLAAFAAGLMWWLVA